MSVKIVELEAENVKRVKAVQIVPATTGLTIIGGNNDQGKTTIINSLLWGLGGEKYRPVAAQRDGACPAWQRWKAWHDAVKAQIDTARAAEQEFQAAQADKRARYQCRQQRGNALGRKI